MFPIRIAFPTYDQGVLNSENRSVIGAPDKFKMYTIKKQVIYFEKILELWSIKATSNDNNNVMKFL
jgi:hypothetical protein